MAELKEKMVCGIVMPISAVDGCDESHWTDVYDILSEAIEEAGFDANLVSHADDVGIIHKRIIQNLYDNPVVVCDVSGKNPNVMFELGMRLAFDKPTIIVKDEKTSYSFDTSAIEHLEYPRDLRFSRIIEFKEKLTEKIKATYEKAKSDSTYTTFLKHFGEFTVAKLDKKEVSGQEYIIEELRNIRGVMRRLAYSQGSRGNLASQEIIEHDRVTGDEIVDVCMRGSSEHIIAEVLKKVSKHPHIRDLSTQDLGTNHKHIIATISPDANRIELKKFIRSEANRYRLENKSAEKTRESNSLKNSTKSTKDS